MSETRGLLMEKDGAIGWITFNNPERRNAVSQEMWQLMPEVVGELAADDAIRVVILRGAGDRAFVAGAGISQFKERRRHKGHEEGDPPPSRPRPPPPPAPSQPPPPPSPRDCAGGGVRGAI